MAKKTFAIDDKLSTTDNLAAYAEILKEMDAQLGDALSQSLASFAAGQVDNAAAIWDALYAALAKSPEATAPEGEARAADRE